MSATPSSSSLSSTGPPSTYRPVGIALAVGSGVLIGSSFVFKKKGLLASQAGHEAGKGVAYLKSPMWWTGMIMMICGELCNFGAYAFVEAILVTPLGALSVVICAILSHFFLKENLTLFGWIGCIQCILGAVIIAMNGPQEQSVSTILEFKKLFLAPGFLAYGSVCIAIALLIIFYFAPRYGKRSMLWYISVCSLIGGISVSCTQGLGACIVTSIRGQNQFKNWFTYFLLVFVACTLLTEIYYLNVALAMFNTAMVTPTYYVLFTFCTLLTSVILYQGLKASGSQIMTIVLAFFVICTGIFILQMSKIDPRRLSKVDRRTTILLQAARAEVIPPDELLDEEFNEDLKERKIIQATEEPGVDAVAGRFGAISGSIVRARRRATIQGAVNRKRKRKAGGVAVGDGHPGNGRGEGGGFPDDSGFGLQMGEERSNGSIGMDSVRARALHERWKEEKRAESEKAQDTDGGPKVNANIEGLPITRSMAESAGGVSTGSGGSGSSSGGTGGQPNGQIPQAQTRPNGNPREPDTGHSGTRIDSQNPSTEEVGRPGGRVLLSREQLTSSPLTTPMNTPPMNTSTAELELRKQTGNPSVHFSDEVDRYPSRSIDGVHGRISNYTSIGNGNNLVSTDGLRGRDGGGGGGEHANGLSPLPTALIASNDTSRPTMNLPPARRLAGFFSRFGNSSSASTGSGANSNDVSHEHGRRGGRFRTVSVRPPAGDANSNVHHGDAPTETSDDANTTDPVDLRDRDLEKGI